MAVVHLEHVTKLFGKVLAVNAIDLTVPDGTFVVLVGPSGCGKTTVLRMIAGLEEPTSGTIRIGDQVVNRLAPKDRDIAMVFQNYALYPHMDVYGNLAFSLRLRRVAKTEIDRRVCATAELLGIAEKLKSKPRELSGGQRQRVAVGRAIVRSPKVFLFDEPLSNLDAKLRVQMRTELLQLHQQLRTTTVYVTHDQVEAMTLGGLIAVMKEGTIQQYAPPQMAYDRPTNEFVASFIGSPAMNFLPARFFASHGGGRLCGEGFDLRIDRGGPEDLPSEVTIGIRPEAFSGPVAPEGVDTLRVRVRVTEALGYSLLVYGDCGSEGIVASLPPRSRVAVGSTIGLSVMPSSIHVFDRVTKRSLESSSGSDSLPVQDPLPRIA